MSDQPTPDATTDDRPDEQTPPSGSSREDQRARDAGLPLDSGAEETVLRVRRSLWRARPLATLAMALLPIGVIVFTHWIADPAFGLAAKIFGISAALSWGAYGVWWVATTRTAHLEITNKRTIERRGLFSRSSNEVLHDHVRNIRITQTLADRVCRVGSVGISSSGQDGIEIEMRDLPRPAKIREVIDVYRPL
jgi:hypothetical protein